MATPLTATQMQRLAAMLEGGNTFGGRTFGGNTFGGRTFGGNTFGASAVPPDVVRNTPTPNGLPAAPRPIPPALQNGVNTNRVMLPPPGAAPVAPPPPAPPVPGAQGAPTGPAISPEETMNQNPPAPNPPLATAPPPVTSASFGAPPAGGGAALPPGAAVPPPPPASGFPTLQPSTIEAMPSPVGSDPSMGDETIRQTLERAMRRQKMPRAQWAQNFGNLADQQG